MSLTKSTDASPRSATPARASLRPEIQALRALAVVLVVVYHYWPGVARGGYVGVDVFFAISGFLITAHLLRSDADAGASAIVTFWARRVRRLLPASLLVLLVTAVAVLVIVPRTLWQQFLSEVVASALYVQNWLLASNSVDYLASNNVASPVQHFWSLSTEEQFYLVWPVLIIGAGVAAAHHPRARRPIIGCLLGAVALASLVYGVYLTAEQPSVAYFATTTRAWEFAAGGLLAFFRPTASTGRDRGRSVVSWAGVVLVAGSAFGFSGATPFPGIAALVPVAGTLLVIWAGMPTSTLAPSRAYALRPVQFTGDISYSLYLWHFPLLILAGYALGSANGLPVKLALVLLAVVLAAATKRFVEDPLRGARFLVDHRRRRTFALMAIAMAIVVAVAGLGLYRILQDIDSSQREAGVLEHASPACFGAAALATPRPDCPATTPVTKIVPLPDVADDDQPLVATAGCLVGGGDPVVRSCVFGRTSASLRVALIGDSHAAAWFPALDALAAEKGWQLTTYLKSGCPFARGRRLDSAAHPGYLASCVSWNDSVSRILSKARPYDLVITSAYESDSEFVDAHGASSATVSVAAYRAAWRPLISRGSTVVALHDTPHAGVRGQTCFTDHPDVPSQCDLRPSATKDRTDYLSAAAVGLPGAIAIDMNDYFCTANLCPIIVGGVFVYRDENHFTATFSESLAPALFRRLSSAHALRPAGAAGS